MMSTSVLPYFGSKGDIWDLGIKVINRKIKWEGARSFSQKVGTELFPTANANELVAFVSLPP